MTPAQIENVKDSYHYIHQVRYDLSRTYYEELFRIAPGVRACFPEDMTAQGIKLAHTVGYMVAHLHEIGVLDQTISHLARRNVKYGMRPQHFAPAGVAFIRALEHHLPSEVSETETDAWLAFYGMITDMMVEEMTVLLKAA